MPSFNRVKETGCRWNFFKRISFSWVPLHSQSQMSKPQQPIVLSDDEEENDQNALSSPPPFQPFHCSNKKRRTGLYPYPNLNTQTPVLVLDDDDDATRPTRKPPGPTSSRYFEVLDSLHAQKPLPTPKLAFHIPRPSSPVGFCYYFTHFVWTRVSGLTLDFCVLCGKCLVICHFGFCVNFLFMLCFLIVMVGV